LVGNFGSLVVCWHNDWIVLECMGFGPIVNDVDDEDEDTML